MGADLGSGGGGVGVGVGVVVVGDVGWDRTFIGSDMMMFYDMM